MTKEEMQQSLANIFTNIMGKQTALYQSSLDSLRSDIENVGKLIMSHFDQQDAAKETPKNPLEIVK